MEIHDLQYKSAYVMTKLNLDSTIFNFSKLEIGKMNLYYDEHLDIKSYEKEASSIYLLGYCYDIRDGLKQEENILKELLNSSKLHDDLDYIGGRYILILNTGENQFIYSDPLQVKPLVYHAESESLASHDTLLNYILTEHNYEITKPSGYKNNSLDYTQFVEIKKYNPSLYTDFKNFEFIRFYPRTQLETRNVEDVFTEMKPYLDEVIKYLRSLNQTIFVTVTGGIDSRVSASLTRDFSNQLEYLTYTKKRETLDTPLKKLVYRNDEAITAEMKKYLGWNHTIIDLDDYKPSQSEVNTYLKKFNSRHAYSLINYYRDHKKYYKALHIKSTAFGMGKADFSKELDNKEDTHEFYEKCLYGLPRGFKQQPDYNEKIKDFFSRNLMHEGYPMGRHFYDLFYLESRMGNWHSSLTLETDPETDEFILINTRKFIDLIMSPSIDDRRQHKLYKTIINHYWPVLLKFDINKLPKNDKYQLYDATKVELQEIAVLGLNKVSIEKEGNGVIVKPKTKQIYDFEMYTFAITSKTDDNKKIRITSFYKNIKAKDKIKVLIKQAMFVETYDILELNNGIEVDISSGNATISIYYSYNFDKQSWVNAGRLKVEEI